MGLKKSFGNFCSRFTIGVAGIPVAAAGLGLAIAGAAITVAGWFSFNFIKRLGEGLAKIGVVGMALGGDAMGYGLTGKDPGILKGLAR